MQLIRLTQVKKLLKENNLDAALISSLSNIIYFTDFHYFTDLEREVFILVTQKNNYIFTDARYSHAVKKHIKNFTLLEISIDNPFTKLLQKICDQEKIKSLGLEEDNITVAEHKKISAISKNNKHFDLRTLRAIKNAEEIKKIKKACQIGDRAFSSILKEIKLGISEKELAFKLETIIRQLGCEPSFLSIVAFGENAAIPHHKTGKRKLKKNEFVLLDFGVQFEGYCSDMTRIVVFGKENQKQKKVYETVFAAQQKAFEYIKKQLLQGQIIKGIIVDKIARDYIAKNNFPVFSHGLGHGVGLQVHEGPRLSPLSKDELLDGMVFSIEPGIYLPDKIGVRIEDLFALQNGKLIHLTKAPKKLIEVTI